MHRLRFPRPVHNTALLTGYGSPGRSPNRMRPHQHRSMPRPHQHRTMQISTARCKTRTVVRVNTYRSKETTCSGARALEMTRTKQQGACDALVLQSLPPLSPWLILSKVGVGRGCCTCCAMQCQTLLTGYGSPGRLTGL